jgi:hypothetical protein
MNIQHSTLNIEHPMKNARRKIDKERGRTKGGKNEQAKHDSLTHRNCGSAHRKQLLLGVKGTRWYRHLPSKV